MKINKLNYEAFALDYLEVTLSFELVEAMEEFLLKHPAIKVELEEMRNFPVLMPERIPFDNKKQLLKQASREKMVWLNPLRWSVAASMLLAIMCLFFSKQQQMETIATTTPEEVINTNLNQPILSKELTVEKEIIVVENQVIKETTIVSRTMTANAASLEAKQQERLVSLPKEKEVIADYTKSNQQLVKAFTYEPSTIVAPKKEEENQLAMSTPPLLEQRIIKIVPVATLIAKDIALLELPMDNELGNTMQDLSEAVNTAIANTPERKSLKRFIGKLPGNGVKISLIPSFFAD